MMGRIFAFIGNRPDLGAELLSAQPEVVSVHRGDQPLGWGIGLFQAGEILLRRRPTDERVVVDLGEAVRATRTTTLLGHVRSPTSGELRTENMQPFRHGGWLFASSCGVPGYDGLRARLLEALPPFLRNNVRGETEAEALFYVYLSFLHDSGALRDNGVRPEQVRAALRGAVSLVDRFAAEDGQAKSDGDLFVSNGELLVVAHRSGPLGMRTFRGRAEIESVLGEELASVPSMDSSRFTLLLSGLDPLPIGWERLPDRVCVTADPTHAPQIEAF
jgi:glutamine amidotransferase